MILAKIVTSGPAQTDVVLLLQRSKRDDKNKMKAVPNRSPNFEQNTSN